MENDLFNPQQAVAIDTETTGLRAWLGDRPFAVSLCDEEANTWYCEWSVDPLTRQVFPNPDDVAFINQYTMNPSLDMVFHNAKFDVRMLEFVGCSFFGEVHDTHIAARICNNLEFSYGLKSLSRLYLGIGSDDETDLKKELASYRRMAQAHNKRVDKDPTSGDKIAIMKTASEAAADYWLPKWYDPASRTCEKYCRLDTVRTMGLHMFYDTQMDSDQLLRDGYEFERKLWRVVNKMEKRGMRVSEDKVAEQLRIAKLDREKHHNEMIKMIKDMKLQPFKEPWTEEKELSEFNPDSTHQIPRILYLPAGKGGLGLHTDRVTAKGAFSTDKKALRELLGNPFVQSLSGFRAADQAISLFFEKYLFLMVDDHISPGEKVLHPGLNQCGTVTGRFSGSDPNLQQVGNPKTSSDSHTAHYQARAPFGPRKGYVLYAGDYSQQELRIFASIAKIPFLLQEINAGRDPNSACANKAWGGKGNIAALKAASYALDLGSTVPTSDQVARIWEQYDWNADKSRKYGLGSDPAFDICDQWLSQHNYEIVAAEKSVGRSNSRGRAKCVVFAKIYGGGPSSVTELLYCSMKEARDFLEDYNVAIPEINVYMKQMTRQAQRDKYVVNPYGRKIYVEPGYEYKAVNYMIQSTAALMMKDSMIRIDEFFQSTKLDAHILMTIHDELMFEIRREHCYKWLLRGMLDIMEDNEDRITVPMPVELKRSYSSWDEKETVQL